MIVAVPQKVCAIRIVYMIKENSMILNVYFYCSTFYIKCVLKEVRLHIKIWNFIFCTFSLANVKTIPLGQRFVQFHVLLLTRTNKYFLQY
jgi:hypothetical protein